MLVLFQISSYHDTQGQGGAYKWGLSFSNAFMWEKYSKFLLFRTLKGTDCQTDMQTSL